MKKKSMLAIRKGALLIATTLVAVLFLYISPEVGADAVDPLRPVERSNDGAYLRYNDSTQGDANSKDSRSMYPSIVTDVALVASNLTSTSGLFTNDSAVVREVYVQTSAYTSRVQETDSTPFITASNTHVRRGTVATNFLPFGTKVRFPDHFGDEVFTVEDRMNKRYTYNMDIWFADLDEARDFGRRTVRVQILES